MSDTPKRLGLLQQNPEPIKLVSAAQRDVWTRTSHRWRCDHEDGRGRCTSRETVGHWNPVLRTVEHLCEKHARVSDNSGS